MRSITIILIIALLFSCQATPEKPLSSTHLIEKLTLHAFPGSKNEWCIDFWRYIDSPGGISATFSSGAKTESRQIVSFDSLKSTYDDIVASEVNIQNWSEDGGTYISIEYSCGGLTRQARIKGWNSFTLHRSALLSNLLYQILPYQLKAYHHGYITLSNRERPVETQPAATIDSLTIQVVGRDGKECMLSFSTTARVSDDDFGEASLIGPFSNEAPSGWIRLYWPLESAYEEVTRIFHDADSGCMESQLRVRFRSKDLDRTATFNCSTIELVTLLHRCPRLASLLWQVAPVERCLSRFEFVSCKN